MGDISVGPSRLEQLAEKSIQRSALGSFNLAGARAKLTELLANIGRTAEFSTYTKHDITHIDALLASADWLIPKETWEHITVADALVMSLAMYVHDLGMLVTKSEFAARESSTFPVFREGILEDESSRGVDFRDRLAKLADVDREHFIYEEFVRVHHAERIEAWILGRGFEGYGVSHEAVELVQEVLRDLNSVIRTDIALVARSHHADDLDDLGKYKTNRSYGNARDDEANLHYAALILRSADLVHMTSDRTPTIQYRLASPTDPLGQREWRKQAAVRAVKPSRSAETRGERIEVHATFDDPEGYFALMEYLDYCDSQLTQSANWAAKAAESELTAEHYAFPWHAIDREQIEANTFNKNQFSFSFDQQKVLDLLTGHTLYNDASVAIREIAQNAIDAVRLERHVRGEVNDSEPDVVVEYDPELRTLRVRDRGTGMTEQTLQSHFLRVGSSSYQSKEFIDKHPEFASISRFGIGVLSAFMIADEVRVATIAAGETVGRELVLKSVHGRYLMRDLDRSGAAASRIGANGTEIEIKLRASSEFSGTIVDLLRQWIILPRCSVVCRIPGQEDVSIGWDSPAAALKGLLNRATDSARPIRVTERTVDGVQVAIAEVYNPFFKEWEILREGESRHQRRLSRGAARIAEDGSELPAALAGVCVQGIRVTDSLPGWRDSPIVLADISGSAALRTNVARTDLEAGPPLDQLVEAIYRSVLEAIGTQVPELTEKASLRFALKEAHHIFVALARTERGNAYDKPKAMRKVLSEYPLHPVEVASILEARSALDLRDTGFSVLIGPAADDAARFMDWLPEPKGMMAILREGGLLKGVRENELPLLGGRETLFAYGGLLWSSFEVSKVRSLEGGRSLLLDLAAPAASPRWERELLTQEVVSLINSLADSVDRVRFSRRSEYTNLYCIDEDVIFDDLPADAQVVFVGDYRLLGPESHFARIRRSMGNLSAGDVARVKAVMYLIAHQISPSRAGRIDAEDDQFASMIEAYLNSHPALPLRRELIELLHAAPSMPVWSTSTAWQRRGDTG